MGGGEEVILPEGVANNILFLISERKQAVLTRSVKTKPPAKSQA